MPKLTTLQVQTPTATKIAIGYIIGTALFVFASFTAAVFTTFSIDAPGKSGSVLGTSNGSQVTTFAAPGFTLTPRTIVVNGTPETYMEARVPASGQ